MPLEEMKAYLVTRGAHYRGNLVYSDAPAAARPRLLDFLNSRARARNPADQKGFGILRMDEVEMLVLEGNSRVSKTCPTVSVALSAVIVAFDMPRPRSSSAPAAVTYEKRMAQTVERVVVLTRSRHRLIGSVHGGIKRLGVRSPDEQFIAMTDVTLEDLSSDAGGSTQLPFVALNMDFFESFWAD